MSKIYLPVLKAGMCFGSHTMRFLTGSRNVQRTSLTWMRLQYRSTFTEDLHCSHRVILQPGILVTKLNDESPLHYRGEDGNSDPPVAVMHPGAKIDLAFECVVYV
jgi:hypothetical protein